MGEEPEAILTFLLIAFILLSLLFCFRHDALMHACRDKGNANMLCWNALR
jgi:hypothetical protein